MKAETLKKSILQYAMEGKLVPQDPNDEPASELLKRIKAEKEQLIKEGKIKKDKTESYIFKGEDNKYYEQIGSKIVDITDEIPFEIPQGWEWVRLGNIVNIARGGSPRPIQDYLTTAEDGLNWIKIGDTDKGGKYINSTKEKITPDGLHKTRFVRKGDFLLSNSMSFGRPYILNIDGCIHDGWLVLSEVDYCFNKDFLYYLLSSHYIYQQFCGKVSGAVVKNLNSEKVSGALICLPPLPEQKRIVDKLEQILPLIDEYKINEEKLSKLNETLPAKIKQSILQHAVQGKLVEQDPNDEPASELLKRIKVEKEQLIKEGKIKKDKTESYIYKGEDNNYYEQIGSKTIDITDEIPFDIPDTWQWVRLTDIGEVSRGKSKHRPRNDKKLFGGQYPFIQTGDVARANTYIITHSQTYNEIGLAQSRLFPKNTICITIAANIGDVAILSYDACFPDSVVGIIPFNSVVKGEYILCLLKVVKTQLEKFAPATAQKNINLGILDKLFFPLPPIKEQERIVNKVKKINKLVDSL